MGKKAKTNPAPAGNSTAETALGQGPPRIVPNAGYMAGPAAASGDNLEGSYVEMPSSVGPAGFGESTDYMDIGDDGTYLDVKPLAELGDDNGAANGKSSSPGLGGGSSYFDVMGAGAGGMSNFGAKWRKKQRHPINTRPGWFFFSSFFPSFLLFLLSFLSLFSPPFFFFLFSCGVEVFSAATLRT